MQAKIHLISDLDYGFNEFSDPIELEIPEVDLIVLNGNIGQLKRSIYYAEMLCKKYPEIPIIYNVGWIEQYKMNIGKSDNEQIKNTINRFKLNPQTPKNLHFSLDPQIITFKNGYSVDILTAFGFCEIHKVKCAWEDTVWFKNCVSHVNYVTGHVDGIDTDDVHHGHVPVFADQKWMQEQYELEWKKVKAWELDVTCKKLLITNINPLKDPLYNDLEVTPYLIHLLNGMWLCAGPKVEINNFLGAKLISNPGRGLQARQHVITLDL